MAKKKEFIDPLKDIDPIMEEAFQSEKLQPEKLQKSTTTKKSKTEEKISSSKTPNIAQIQFPALTPQETAKKVEEDIFGNIPIKVSVELGRTDMSLKEIYELNEGSIIELERFVGEPLDLVVNGQIIAQGEVVAVDNNFGLRLTSIVAKEQNL